MRLFLASASPRRQSLLSEAGYEFIIHPADVDEEAHLNRMLPVELAAFLADIKARNVSQRFPGDVTLAADTVVAFGDTALGKPEDPSQARAMLELLSGTTHIVITGVAVHCPEKSLALQHSTMSAVRMDRLTALDIDRYLETGLWRGKAGGYGIQDRDPLVTCISGSNTNVIGLPMTQTKRLLEQAGIRPGAR